MPKEKSIVGDLINFRGLVYSPVNEQGVVYLFSKVAEDLNMYVEEVRTAFPDCIARRFTGKGWEKVYIEFEFRSLSFQRQGHDPAGCDIIVCWENDWKDCPIEVMELKSTIQGLPNRDVTRPKRPEGSSEQLFDKGGTPAYLRKLYRELESEVLRRCNGAWVTPKANEFVFYSPKRPFAYVGPQTAKLRLFVFTDGEAIEGISTLEWPSGGMKWGTLAISDADHLPAALNAIRVAHERILYALQHNEPTGWNSPVKPESEDDEPAPGQASQS